MYLEVSDPIQVGQNGILSTPSGLLSPGSGPFKLTFWVYMYGKTVGPLTVKAVDNQGRETTVFSQTGQGTLSSTDMAYVFISGRGTNPRLSNRLMSFVVRVSIFTVQCFFSFFFSFA